MQATRLANNFESQMGANGSQTSGNINAIAPVVIDKTTPTERVNAPGLPTCLKILSKELMRKRKFPKLRHKTLF